MDQSTGGFMERPLPWLTIIQTLVTIALAVATTIAGIKVGQQNIAIEGQKNAIDTLNANVSELQVEYKRENDFSQVIRESRANLGTTQAARTMIDVAGLYAVTNSVHEKCIVIDLATVLPSGNARGDLESLITYDPDLQSANVSPNDKAALSSCVEELKPRANSLGGKLDKQEKTQRQSVHSNLVDVSPNMSSEVAKTLSAITLPTSKGWVYVGNSSKNKYTAGMNVDRSKIKAQNGDHVLTINSGMTYELTADANLREEVAAPHELGAIIGVLNSGSTVQTNGDAPVFMQFTTRSGKKVWAIWVHVEVLSR
jgi:hypothetical protein